MPIIGKATFKEGVVYELSNKKFIFKLINLKKHSYYYFSLSLISEKINNTNHILLYK